MLELGQKIVKIPVSSRLNPVDREQAQSICAPITTPEEARMLVSAQNPPWAMRQLDGLGKVFVLTYKGCQIRLMYQRQVLDEIVDEGTPIPPYVLKNYRQEWVAFNLVDDVEKNIDAREATTAVSDSTMRENLAYQHLNEVRTEYLKQKQELNEEVLKYRLLAEKAIDITEEQKKDIARLQGEIKSAIGRAGNQVVQAKNEGMRKAVAELISAINVLDTQKDKFDWAFIALNAALNNLRGLGFETIAPVTGDVFDPNFHHAVEVLEMEDEHAGKIIERQSIGIRQGQIIIKAADVVV